MVCGWVCGRVCEAPEQIRRMGKCRNNRLHMFAVLHTVEGWKDSLFDTGLFPRH